MRIGNTYNDNKIYRGIKNSNNLPLLAEDLHEFSDTMMAKNNYLLESILGSGMLTEIEPILSNTGISLNKPLVLNIRGDICLVKNSDNTNLIESSELTPTGTIFLVGWYQNITATSTMRDYGGVRNSILENNLLYEPLGIQVSSRYQFRWDIVTGQYSDQFSISLPLRDINGNLTGASSVIKPTTVVGSIHLAEAPSAMDYAVDGLYIIPLFTYIYNNTLGIVTSIESYPIRKTSSNSTIIESVTEPADRKMSTGTVWYNPNTREFKTYIEGTGFVANASKMGFIQYQYMDIASSDILTPTDILYNIDVPTLQEEDIIHVTYEGLEIIRDTDYSIDIEDKTITLLGFTRNVGEKLVVTVTRLVEASDVTSLTSTVVTHINTKGNNTVEGHVKLSDSTNSSSDSSDGVAATPKAVSESKILTDDTTGTKYKFGVEDGILYIEEV